MRPPTQCVHFGFAWAGDVRSLPDYGVSLDLVSISFWRAPPGRFQKGILGGTQFLNAYILNVWAQHL